MSATRWTAGWVSWAIFVVLMAAWPLALLAQAVTPDGAPPTPHQTLAAEGVWSLLMAFYLPRLMDWLKCQGWFPLLREGARRMNRWTAIGTAVLTASGVHWSFTHGVDGWQFVAGGAHQTLTGFLGQALLQFAAQQAFHEVKQGARAADPPV